MSFLAPRSASLGRPPTSSDDASRGFFVGSTVVDSSADPPVLYLCTRDAQGAALWVAAGAATSGWANYTAFEAENGQTVFLVAGVNPAAGRHMVTRNGLVLRQGVTYDYTVNAAGIVFNVGASEGDFVQVFA